jgi:hypothetical protein
VTWLVSASERAPDYSGVDSRQSLHGGGCANTILKEDDEERGEKTTSSHQTIRPPARPSGWTPACLRESPAVCTEYKPRLILLCARR